MNGIDGDRLHPDSNSAGIAQQSFFFAIVIPGVTVSIIKYVLFNANNFLRKYFAVK